MNAVQIDRSYRNQDAPAWQKYRTELRPQPASIYLDADGNAWVDVQGSIGAHPAEAHYSRWIGWEIPADITVSGIDALFADIAPALEIVHAGHTIEWNGDNYSGRLTEAAREAYEAIQRTIDYGDYERAEILDTDSLTQWIYSHGDNVLTEYDAAPDKEAYAAELAEEIRTSGDGPVIIAADVKQAIEHGRVEV